VGAQKRKRVGGWKKGIRGTAEEMGERRGREAVIRLRCGINQKN